VLCEEARNLPAGIRPDKPELALLALYNGLILNVKPVKSSAHSLGAAQQHKPCGLW
jgi:hypothetical protein